MARELFMRDRIIDYMINHPKIVNAGIIGLGCALLTPALILIHMDDNNSLHPEAEITTFQDEPEKYNPHPYNPLSSNVIRGTDNPRHFTP